MFFDSNKHKSETSFPNLANKIDMYINSIETHYNVGSNTKNLENIIRLFNAFLAMSEEEFLQQIQGVSHIGEIEFSRIYFILHGDAGYVKELLEMNGRSVAEENMNDYVQFMKNATAKRLEKNIDRLEKMLVTHQQQQHYSFSE